MRQRKQPAQFWQRFDINQIEDLGNAVLGAELEAMQMAGPPAQGSLAFAAHGGVIFSTGLIKGRVSVTGPLSRDALTLGIGLRFGPASRLWLNPVADGDVGVFLPGEACDALFGEESLYFAASLSEEALQKEAASEDLVLDRRSISHTGLCSRPIAHQTLAALRDAVVRVHRDPSADDDRVGRAILRTVIDHWGRFPIESPGRNDPVGLGLIVHRAREYIHANLDAPISLDAIALAAETSRRTLARAFFQVLGDTPAGYIRRLRLHRIRRDLVRNGVAGRTIHETAAASGIREAGRMAGRYRELFGEYPHETVNERSKRQRHGAAV